jgi:hypothetical protein
MLAPSTYDAWTWKQDQLASHEEDLTNCDGMETLANAIAAAFVAVAAALLLVLCMRRISVGDGAKGNAQAAVPAMAPAAAASPAPVAPVATAAAMPEGAAAQATAPERDLMLDNAKFCAMVLVVASHIPSHMYGYAHGTWTRPDASLRPTRFDEAIWLATWFHMPLFAILSGAVTRSMTAARFSRLVTTLVAPLVLYELVLRPVVECWLVGLLTGGAATPPSVCGVVGEAPIFWRRPLSAIACPSDTGKAWYLHVLITWRLALRPLLDCIPCGYLRAAAVLSLGILAAYAPSGRDALFGLCSDSSVEHAEGFGPFSVIRSLSLAPFFFLGGGIDLAALARLVTQPCGGTYAGWALYCVFLAALVASPDDGVLTMIVSAVEVPSSPFSSYRPVAIVQVRERTCLLGRLEPHARRPDAQPQLLWRASRKMHASSPLSAPAPAALTRVDAR